MKTVYILFFVIPLLATGCLESDRQLEVSPNYLKHQQLLQESYGGSEAPNVKKAVSRKKSKPAICKSDSMLRYVVEGRKAGMSWSQFSHYVWESGQVLIYAKNGKFFYVDPDSSRQVADEIDRHFEQAP